MAERKDRVAPAPAEASAGRTPSVVATAPADRSDRAGLAVTPVLRVSWDDGPEGVVAPGTAIGRYVVLDSVGAGAMGVVYAAHDRDLDRRVALKLVRDPRRSSARQRLLREAQALAQLSHPNVVAVFDVGTYRDQVFLAMEFVHGQTLRAWLAARPRTRDEVIEVYRRAGEGLAAAHAAGIVHRDFKPDNVLVDQRGRVRVADFGLAFIDRGEADERGDGEGRGGDATGESSTTERDDDTVGSGKGLTATGVVLGTPAYMSPEQRNAAAPVDARADQFSFCVALYEALCGQRPYEVSDTVAASPVARRGRRGAAIPEARALTRDQDRDRDRAGADVEVEGDAVAVDADAADAALPAEPAASEVEIEIDPESSAFILPIPPPASAASAATAPSVTSVRKLPPRIRRLLGRGLCIDPDDRYPTMAALLADLDTGGSPRRRRRLLAFGAAGVGVVALAAAVLFSAAQGEEPPCRGAAARLAGVWDPARGQAVRAAFRATGSPLAESSYSHVARSLDGWAAGWISAHTDACEATQVRGEQSAALLDLRMECLDLRRDEALALVDLLSSADVDRETVARSVQAAQSLTPLDRCADRAALVEELPPPSDPVRHAQVIALRRRLAAVQAQNDAGQIGKALAPIRQIAAEAAALDYRPLEAETQATLAEVERDSGNLAASEEALYRAIAAGEAGRMARLIAEAWIDLADLVGLRGGRSKDGHRLARLARGAVDRLGGDDVMESALENLIAGLYLVDGELDEARPHLERAIALGTKAHGRERLFLAEPLQRLASLEEAAGHHDEAIRLVRQAYALVEAELGPENPDVLALVTGEGSALHAAGRVDEAIAVWRRGLSMSEKVVGPVSPLVASFLNDIGMALRDKGDLPGALTNLQRALSIDVQLNGPDHVDAAPEYHNIGNTLWGMKRFDEAVSSYGHAVAIYERLGGPDRVALAQSLAGLGEAHADGGHADRALAPLERAVSIYDRTEAPLGEEAEARFILARALWDSRRDRPRARRLAATARADLEKSGHPDFAAVVAKWIRVTR
ncbi:MAG TPA: serine/threonine-protein kinase [Kofleriaceae bacterium]|nr:serine/threonine-protein kinase [Kofleriaceae bacterium]